MNKLEKVRTYVRVAGRVVRLALVIVGGVVVIVKLIVVFKAWGVIGTTALASLLVDLDWELL